MTPVEDCVQEVDLTHQTPGWRWQIDPADPSSVGPRPLGAVVRKGWSPSPPEDKLKLAPCIGMGRLAYKRPDLIDPLALILGDEGNADRLGVMEDRAVALDPFTAVHWAVCCKVLSWAGLRR